MSPAHLSNTTIACKVVTCRAIVAALCWFTRVDVQVNPWDKVISVKEQLEEKMHVMQIVD